MKIIRQRDEADCGVCALASIIEHYNGYVPLEKIRLDAKTDSKGTSALNLVLASQKYGFESVGVKLKNIYDITKLPAIAHLSFKNGLEHYVVIEKIAKDKITLMDPAKGKVIESLAKFNEAWSKVVLLFYPKTNITVLKENVTIFKIYQTILTKEKTIIKTILMTSFLLSIFTLLLSYYNKILSSFVNSGYTKDYIKVIVIIFASITLLKISLSYFRKYLENHLNKNIDCYIISDFINHLYHLPLNVISSRKPGEIVSRINELSTIKEFIVDLFLLFTLDILVAILITPLLFKINKTLFIILLIELILYLITNLITTKVIYKKVYQNITYNSEFSSILLDDISTFNSIKNLSLVNNHLKVVEKSLTNYLYDTFKLNNFLNKDYIIKYTIDEVSLFLIITLGFYYLAKGSIDLIDMVTFTNIMYLFITPFKNIVNILIKYNYIKATISKINDFLSIEKEPTGVLQEIYGYEIVINNLSYSYNKYQKIFKSISFKIKEGSFVLLKGPSGCGKSTICNILTKNLTDYEGSISIGTINIKDLSLKTINSNITYVNQHEKLFKGTIKENIVLDNDISEVEFEYLCYLCKLDKIIINKPLRYNTFISDDEKNISGGEKQRIILARALLKETNILILDEALSEIDLKTEISILKNIRKVYPEKTIIYVSHKKYPKIFSDTIDLKEVLWHT